MKNKDLATSSEEAVIAKYRKKGPRCLFAINLDTFKEIVEREKG